MRGEGKKANILWPNFTFFSSAGGALAVSFTFVAAAGGVCFGVAEGGVSWGGAASLPFGVLLPELPPSDSPSAQMESYS